MYLCPFRRRPVSPINGDTSGVLAQLVERNVRNVEVRGSTPLCSTLRINLMTQEEQKRIIRSLETLGEQGAVALSQRLEEWATKQFSKNGEAPELGSRGLFVQYRVAAVEEW